MMFARQKKYLAEAAVLHKAASRRKEVARRRFKQRRHEFLGEPLNLLYPYIAGILICASQLKNDATGLKRIPFMNIAKAGVGVWTLISRIRKVRDKRSSKEDQLDDNSYNQPS